MAKKRIVSYEKRQRELRKQKKAQAKLEARRARRAAADGGAEPEADLVPDVEISDPAP